jgi:hypothetical protein
MLPTPKGRGLLATGGGARSRWNGHQRYRNYFTRRTCPARTVRCKGCPVGKSRQLPKEPRTPLFFRCWSKTALPGGHAWPAGHPAFIPLAKRQGASAGFCANPCPLCLLGGGAFLCLRAALPSPLGHSSGLALCPPLVYTGAWCGVRRLSALVRRCG